MPSTLDPGDRKLLLIGGGILILLIVATVVFAPAPDEVEGQGIPTTYSTTNSGAQAAYLLLGELGYDRSAGKNPPWSFLPMRKEKFSFSRVRSIFRTRRNEIPCWGSCAPAAGSFTQAIFRFSSSKPARLLPVPSRRH